MTKAVWFCEIRIGDWCQTLSCLRMELTQIWPDLKEVPTAANLSVSPSAQPPASGTASAETADDRTAESLGENPPRPELARKPPEAPISRAGSSKGARYRLFAGAPSDPATIGQRDTEAARSGSGIG